MRFFSLGIVVGLAAGVAACSGAATGDFFAGSAGFGAGDDASALGDDGDAAPNDPEDAGIGSRDGGTRKDDGGGDRDGGSPDSGGKDGGGHDAGPPATIDCPATSGAATTTCDVGQAVCCSKGNGSFACTSESACVPPEVAVPCDEATDCAALGQPGDLCCLQLGSNGKGTAVACVAEADCSLPKNRRVMCDPNDPTSCPVGQVCKLSTLTFPGFYVCF